MPTYTTSENISKTLKDTYGGKKGMKLRETRAALAKKHLVPAAIKATGRKGFAATKEALEGKPGITSAERLAGWLKGQAKAKGVLSKEHPYVGRRPKRK